MIKNRGTGAGGSNTNKNGLSYEKKTLLNSHFECIRKENGFDLIKFKNSSTEFIKADKTKLFKFMKNTMNKEITPAHGCKRPDECFINNDKKIIFIIEKKFQKVGGSACEKIQTPDFKVWQYQRLFPNYKIVYIYCLSYWFKNNCKSELEYLLCKNVPVFWGDDEFYKEKLVCFMTNYDLSSL
tara:strand:+ start:1253 stop:1801 length:549 start_codon:yes stop_codon:yes gene_type:complete